ncbi:oxidoreductase [Marivirga tractuosa]|uniref:Short-chain dehydrogenase/reductase SDR n=1 Tax=Marivirga tractuosa (strain ATCC 23168 / DSM 4126 / NBRC 15989 / NCIMB 1408 / VKM B-1430 / H-43) TaxID=643867 RepID=E4TML6_MARTH|nr:SDR family oxidoreductase [Marivirga tractuosa]ADR23450.1 short-chain dehydrogenase/reductase SDR [Marivirga tractuosa DSM 4126]BDD15873.1 oxidoreductase [Marivirga tractuosa]
MNKFIVITGGTKGIGRALVLRFAEKGFDVITCARNKADLEVLKEEIEKSYNNKVHVKAADLSKREDIATFADFVLSTTPRVDVLINNTGIFLPGSIQDEPDGNLEMMMNTNLFSAYHLTRALLPSMLPHKQGHIFSMSSIAGITAYSSGGSYSITKYAMQGFTKCLREELKGEGIRVTSVLPGATFTASWEGVDLPHERFMKAEDVAESVWSAYALSDRTVVEEIVLRPQLGDI